MWSPNPAFPASSGRWSPTPAGPAGTGAWTPVIVRSGYGHELAVATDDGLIRLGALSGHEVAEAIDAGLVVLPGMVGAETAVADDWGMTTPTILGREIAVASDSGTLGAWHRTETAVATDSGIASPGTGGIDTAVAVDSGHVLHVQSGGTETAIATDSGVGWFAWHAPIVSSFTTVGTHTVQIPVQCQRIDIVLIGGGGSGQTGSGAINQAGKGGIHGTWAAITLVRGIDIPWTDQSVSVTVGAGGSQPANSDHAGPNAGSASTATAGGSQVLTAAGGTGTGDQQNGRPVPAFTHQGVTYNGGNSGTGNAGAGQAPGGAGAGGNGGIFGSRTRGGVGGAGGAWVRMWYS